MASNNSTNILNKLDSFVDFNDKGICNIRVSQTSFNVTIIFNKDNDHGMFVELLRNQYNFYETKNNKGISSTFNIHDSKVVITVFNTKTILIQGSGCKEWLGSEFEVLLALVTEETANISTNFSTNMNINETPTPENTTPHPYTELNNNNVNIQSNTSIVGSIGSEETIPKNGWTVTRPKEKSKSFSRKLFSMKSVKKKLSTSTPVIPSNRPKFILRRSPKLVNAENSVENISEIQSIHETEPKCVSVNMSMNQSVTQTKPIEKCDVTTQANLYIETSQQQNSDDKIGTSRQVVSDKKNIPTSELYAQILIQEEENKALKQTNQSLKQENKILRKRITSLETEKDNISCVQTDVGEIKEQLHEINKVLSELKERSETIQSPTQLLACPQEGTQCKPSELPTSETPVITESTKAQQKQCEVKTQRSKKSVLIFGDSVTKCLIPTKMSSPNVKVGIKSLPGAMINQVMNNVDLQTEEDANKPDIVVLHAGINNVTTGHTTEDIMKGYNDLITSVTQKVPSSKIIVSSLLPMRSIKAIDPMITGVNNALKHMCSERSLVYVDHSDAFSGNTSLYYDEVHCNKSGAIALGRNLKQAIYHTLYQDELAEHQNTTNHFRRGHTETIHRGRKSQSHWKQQQNTHHYRWNPSKPR